MNPKQIKTIARLSLLSATLTVIGAGCHGVAPWNLNITKPATASKSIRVDLLGIKASEKDQWQRDVKPDDYWQANSPIRNDVLSRTITNDFQGGATWYISKTNAIWGKWFSYHATELLIMADLPGGPFSNSDSDRRRKFLPLDTKAWKTKDQTLEITIEDSQIQVLTKERPRK
jgi:hypothetical protein